MSRFLQHCLCFLYILIIYVPVIYADYVVVTWVVGLTMRNSFWGTVNVVVFNVIVWFLAFAHYEAAFTDPGFVPLPQYKVDFSDMHSGGRSRDDDSWPVCDKCETYAPPRAHHCKICNRCVRKMDRHCFGINNCVGEENQKYFIQFLFYAALLSLYSMILVIVSMTLDCPDCNTYEIHQMKAWNSSFLCLLSAVFVVVSLTYLADQIRCVATGVTTVEQGQRRSVNVRPHKSKYLMVSEVFGSPHVALWFLPCYKRRMKRYDDSLLGHEV